MKNFITLLSLALGGLVLLFIVAVFAGTLVFWIWPHVIPFAFPGLIAGGFVAAKLAWWKAVLLTWLFSLLFKSSTTSSSN